MKEDFRCFLELLYWFPSVDIASTKPDELVSFFTGLVCVDNRINTLNSEEIGMKMHSLSDGGNFTDKMSLKLKIKKFDNLNKVMKIKESYPGFLPAIQ